MNVLSVPTTPFAVCLQCANKKWLDCDLADRLMLVQDPMTRKWSATPRTGGMMPPCSNCVKYYSRTKGRGEGRTRCTLMEKPMSRYMLDIASKKNGQTPNYVQRETPRDRVAQDPPGLSPFWTEGPRSRPTPDRYQDLLFTNPLLWFQQNQPEALTIEEQRRNALMPAQTPMPTTQTVTGKRRYGAQLPRGYTQLPQGYTQLPVRLPVHGTSGFVPMTFMVPQGFQTGFNAGGAASGYAQQSGQLAHGGQLSQTPHTPGTQYQFGQHHEMGPPPGLRGAGDFGMNRPGLTRSSSAATGPTDAGYQVVISGLRKNRPEAVTEQVLWEHLVTFCERNDDASIRRMRMPNEDVAYVTWNTEENGQAAIFELDNNNLDGFPIRVQWSSLSTPKQRPTQEPEPAKSPVQRKRMKVDDDATSPSTIPSAHQAAPPVTELETSTTVPSAAESRAPASAESIRAYKAKSDRLDAINVDAINAHLSDKSRSDDVRQPASAETRAYYANALAKIATPNDSTDGYARASKYVGAPEDDPEEDPDFDPFA